MKQYLSRLFSNVRTSIVEEPTLLFSDWALLITFSGFLIVYV